MKKILLVDNDRFFLEVIKDLLKQEGHEVLTTEDGLSALDILEGFTPDVIFLDMVMPNIDGKRLCRILRNMKDFKDAYIVSLSATAEEDSNDIIRAGVDASIAKGPLNEMAVEILNVVDKRTGSLETMGPSRRIHQRGITRELLSIKRHFESILGKIDEAIFELAPDGRIVYANPGAVSLMHLAEENMLGRPFLDLFRKGNHHAVRTLLEGRGEKSKQTPVGDPLILNEYQVLMDVHPIPDSEGKLIVILRNVTDHKRAGAGLSESEEAFHLLFADGSDAILVLQDDGIKFANKRAFEMFGFTANELQNLPFFDLVHPEARAAFMERCCQILRGDAVWGIYPLRMLIRSEEELWVELNAVPIHWNGGPAILSFVRDVTRKRRFESHLHQDRIRT